MPSTHWLMIRYHHFHCIRKVVCIKPSRNSYRPYERNPHHRNLLSVFFVDTTPSSQPSRLLSKVGVNKIVGWTSARTQQNIWEPTWSVGKGWEGWGGWPCCKGGKILSSFDICWRNSQIRVWREKLIFYFIIYSFFFLLILVNASYQRRVDLIANGHEVVVRLFVRDHLLWTDASRRSIRLDDVTRLLIQVLKLKVIYFSLLMSLSVKMWCEVSSFLQKEKFSIKNSTGKKKGEFFTNSRISHPFYILSFIM